MSDTPRTDAESFSTVFQGELVKADFARRLERERDAERALADQLAEAFKDLWDNHTMYGAGYEVVEKAITAWKEARFE